MLNNNYENTYGNNPVLLLLLVYAINYHVTHFIIYLLTFRKHFSTLDISLIHIRLRSESEKKKKRSVRDSRTYTQIETQSFHRRVEEGWGGQLQQSGRVVREAGVGRGWQRRTVVFHSHYRNVLPCALVAPRNKSSVTVTMGKGIGGVARER